MFENYDLALTMLQVASGLAGLTLVVTSVMPLLIERTQNRYEEFLAQELIRLLIRLTKLAFGAFTLSVILSLLWCILLASTTTGVIVILIAGGSVLTFLLGLVLTTVLVFRSLKVDIFT